MGDTNQIPEHGWTCFFCGETFRTPGAARDHFGGDLLANVACKIKSGGERGLLMALRKAEIELAGYRAGDSVLAREIHGLQNRHSDALRDAEEAGYERGLADGQALNQGAA